MHKIFVLEQFLSKPETFEKNLKISRATNRELLKIRPSSVSEVSFTYCEIFVINKIKFYIFALLQEKPRRNKYGVILRVP